MTVSENVLIQPQLRQKYRRQTREEKKKKKKKVEGILFLKMGIIKF